VRHHEGPESTANHVVVIGAGVGGLVAALGLAARGVAVTLCERGREPGGKIRQVPAGTRHVDAGPTVFTLRAVFEEIFAESGARLDEKVALRPAGVLARHAWDQTSQLDLSADPETCAEAIGAFAGPGEARRYRRFLADARHIFDTLETPFLRQPSATPMSLVKAAGVADLVGIKPFSRYWQALGTYFHDPRLRQLFGRYATYVGSSPFRAPATLMLVAHVEQSGVWLIDGGLHALVGALADLARDRGVRIRTEAPVAEVRTSKNGVCGVRLESGERLDCAAVIANTDANALAAGYLGAGARKAVPPMPVSQRSLSAVTWTMTARAEGFPLAYHNVFFGPDYAREFQDLFDDWRLPRDPTVYLCAQDRTTAEVQGPSAEAERVLLIVNAPPFGDTQPYDPGEIESCQTRTWTTLERAGLRLIPEPGTLTATSPHDFARMFPGTGGAIYGRASHGWRASFQRPGVRTRLPGLYLASGSAHPGPGVPMAALSGRLASSSLLADWDSRARSRTMAMPGGTSMR